MAKISNPMKQALLEAVRKIPQQAVKDGWVITLDKEEGALYYSPEKIPAGSELYQVCDEYAVYLDKKNKLNGVMIEYYGVNFLKHHIQFEDVNNALFGKKKDSKDAVLTIKPDPKKKDTIKFTKMLEATLVAEATTACLA